MTEKLFKEWRNIVSEMLMKGLQRKKKWFPELASRAKNKLFVILFIFLLWTQKKVYFCIDSLKQVADYGLGITLEKRLCLFSGRLYFQWI